MEKIKQTPGLVLLFIVLLGVSGVSILLGDFTPISVAPVSTANPEPTAQAYRVEGEFEKAAEEWEQAIALNPDDAQAHYQFGLILAVIDPEEAPTHLNRAAELDDSLTRSVYDLTNTLRLASFADEPAFEHILIGQTLADLGEWDLAHALFLRSTKEQPNYAEAWAYLGEAQYHMGEDGYPALAKAIVLDPDSLAANLFMALYWRRGENPEVAMAYLTNAANLDPDNRAIMVEIAYVYSEMGDFTGALDLLVEIAETYPEESSAWQSVARFSVEFKIEVEDVGLSAARQAVVLATEDPAALTLLGRAYMVLGDEFYPEDYFLQAISIDDTYPDARLYLGLVYLGQGKMDKAQVQIETALELGEGTLIGVTAQRILDKYFP